MSLPLISLLASISFAASAPVENGACLTSQTEAEEDNLARASAVQMLQMEVNHMASTIQVDLEPANSTIQHLHSPDLNNSKAYANSTTYVTDTAYVNGTYPVTKKTGSSSIGPKTGGLIYMDRHNILCPPKLALSRWKMVRDGKDKMYFDYECSSDVALLGVPDAVATREASTPFNDQGAGDGELIYLDRHEIMCHDDEFLTHWQLKRNTEGDKVHLAYTCAKSAVYNLPYSCHEKTTGTNDQGDGIIYLDRHDVKCDVGHHMKGWKLTRPKENKIEILYTCCMPTPFMLPVDRTTKQSTKGGDSSPMYYMDRHDLECPVATAMSGWRLVTHGGASISFAYHCAVIPSCGPDRLTETRDLDEGNGNLIYLDRAETSCQKGEVLRKWKYVRVDGGKYKIEYACCEPLTPLAGCTDKTTVKNSDGEGQLIYLDRHDVQCPLGSAMNKWNFERVGRSEFHINYRCCTSTET